MRTLTLRSVLLLLIAVVGVSSRAAEIQNIPLIDAHSQVDAKVSINRVYSALNQAGVSRVILSSLRGYSRNRTSDILALAAAHPDRVTPSIGLKGSFWRNAASGLRILKQEGDNPKFGAMSEMMIMHAPKSPHAPNIDLSFNAPQARAAFALAIKRKWPIVLHIEFRYARAIGEYENKMRGLERLLAQHPHEPIALTHMGELTSGEVLHLLEDHNNIYFLTSHSNPIYIDACHGTIGYAKMNKRITSRALREHDANNTRRRRRRRHRHRHRQQYVSARTGGQHYRHGHERQHHRSGHRRQHHRSEYRCPPWTNLFSGSSIAPQWRALMTSYPQHFILALDNVHNSAWGSFYRREVNLWRKALRRLPSSVANAVAHKNAERLWHLPPAEVIGPH